MTTYSLLRINMQLNIFVILIYAFLTFPNGVKGSQALAFRNYELQQKSAIESSLPLNVTRSKRQLFREDIPQNRPLSGNHYAAEHGFPHPGRWADGMHNPYKIFPKRPHQHYLDMIDDTRGATRGGRYNQEDFGEQDYNSENENGGVKGVSFGVGVDQGVFGDEDYNGPSFPNKEPEPNYDYAITGPEISPKFPTKDPPLSGSYGPPVKDHHPEPPKATIIHYHPIQYSQVLNIPEPQPEHYGPPPPKGPPPPHHSTSYGPPNHQSGTPIGVGGFIPSKGILPDVPKHNHRPHPYRFEPFKIFSHPPPLKQLEHEAPVAIPILAQFHTAKPIKITKLKQPIHLIYEHNLPKHHHRPHDHYGPPRRPHPPPNFFPNYVRPPKFHPGPSNFNHHNYWYYNHH